MIMNRSQPDTFAAMRRRIIRETETALTIGLLSPSSTPRIPIIEVGAGVFDPVFAARYWNAVLELDEADSAA